MSIFEFIQEMMFVNMCVKFRDNRLRNEVCRAVMLLGHVRMNVCMYVRADPYIPSEGIIMVLINKRMRKNADQHSCTALCSRPLKMRMQSCKAYC